MASVNSDARPGWSRVTVRSSPFSSQPENEQHGLVALLPELRREAQPSLRDRAQAGHDRDILLAVDLERHRWRIEPGSDVDLPQRLHGRVVVGDERAVGEAGEDEAAAGRERAA